MTTRRFSILLPLTLLRRPPPRTFPMLMVLPGLPEERTLVRESTSPSATLKRCAESRPFVSRMPSTAGNGFRDPAIHASLRSCVHFSGCRLAQCYGGSTFYQPRAPYGGMGSAAFNFKSFTFCSPSIGNTNGRTGYESSR